MDYLEQELLSLESKINETKVLLDTELAVEAKSELIKLEEQMKSLLVAMKPPEEKIEASENFKSIIVEIRQGVGGDEAKIWAEDLLRMYRRYAEIRDWRLEEIDEGVIKIKGNEVFDTLKYETGVHRVQRVPTTEKAGRIHTSTASVVVLPEVPDTYVEIKDGELEWQFTTGGGHGGQNVNKVATAVRLTHKPTGIVTTARQERTQEQNRKIALSLLRSQLWEINEESKASRIQDLRSNIGRSMRSEKIRTYNYPQNRVTDHRINKSWHKLETIMTGDLDDVVLALQESHPQQPQTPQVEN